MGVALSGSAWRAASRPRHVRFWPIAVFRDDRGPYAAERSGSELHDDRLMIRGLAF